jgi:outer membrane protein
MKQEELAVEIESERRFRLSLAQDWRLNAKASAFHSKPIVTSPFAPTTIDEIALGATFSRSIWNTGGDFSAGWSTDIRDQTIPGIQIPGPGGETTIQTGTPRIYEHSFSLSYTQPLLRNYGGSLDRLDYQLSDYTVAITEYRSFENKEQFLLDLALRFIDWALLEEKARIAEERLDIAVEGLELTEEKREANLVDQVDVLRSEDAVRAARQSLVLFESQARAVQAELAVLAQSARLRELQPDFDLYATVNPPSLKVAIDSIQNTSRAIALLETRKRQLERTRGGFVEAEKPDLDLGLGMALKGGDQEFGGSLEITKPDLSLSLNLSQKLGARAAESDVVRTDLEILQTESQRRSVMLDLEAGLSNLLIQLEDLERILQLNREEIESAQQKTEEEFRLYNQGRSDLNFVIQSRDNVQNAKLIYAENAANYQRLYQRYRALMDLLLQDD